MAPSYQLCSSCNPCGSSGFCHIKVEFGSEVSDGGLGRCMYAWKNSRLIYTTVSNSPLMGGRQMLSLWGKVYQIQMLFSFDSLIFHFSFSQTFFLSDTRGTKNKSELTFITLITAVHPLGVLCRYRCFSEGKEVGTEELEKKEEEQELPECLQLHQMVVRKIGEMCRVVNQVVTSAPQAASLSLFVAA